MIGRNATGAIERGTMLSVAGALGGVWLTMFLLGAGAVDRAVLMAFHAADRPWLEAAALYVTMLGGWHVLLLVTLVVSLWLLWQQRAHAALWLIVTSLSGRGLVILQKAELARLRPDEILRKVEVSSLSFPSGHAANSMVVYLAIALLLWRDPRQRRVAIALAMLLSLAIGISRLVLGVHWPTDVAGGWAFGLLWVLAMLLWLDAAESRKRK